MNHLLIPIIVLTIFSGSVEAANETGQRYARSVDSITMPEESGLSGSVGAGLLLTTGNSDNTNINVDIDAKLDQERTRHNFIATALQTESENEKTAEKYLLGYKFDYKLTPIFYIYSAIRAEQDEFSGFDRQSSLTAGYGHKLVATTKNTLDLELGAGARVNSFNSGDTETETVLRGAADYHHFFSQTAEFHQGLLILGGEDNTSVDSLTAIKAKIIGNLALEAALRAKHNTNPPDANIKTDTTTTLSLAYSF